MARTWARHSRLVALGVAAATALAVAPVASAQLPGVNNNTQVFPVDDERILIAVDEPDLEAGTVVVTVQNNTAQALTCAGIDGGQAGAVTTAEIAMKSVEFYKKFPNSEMSPINVDVDVPSALSGSVGDLGDGFVIDLGSITGMVPGSAAGLVNPEWGALGEIGGAFSQARLGGQYGGMGTSLTIPAGTAEPYTVQLGQTSRGDREEFQAGAVLTCVLNGQRYIFHGYQGEPPVLESDESGVLPGGFGS